MLYKGGDVSLQLGAAAVAREAPTAAPTSVPIPTPPARDLEAAWRRPEAVSALPIAVDEAVLASCNHAFDTALVHGSREVRLEHLLHAMTRVVPAAQVLAGLAIRVDALRRETAMVIAADVPAGPAGTDGAPRASAAFQDALRRAAVHAEARLAPVSVTDVLRALLGDPQSPAAMLLMRVAADPQLLERWRNEPRREAPVAAPPVEAAPPRSADISPALLEALNGRLDRMEAAFRAAREEATADRRITAELLGALQGELKGLQSDGPRVLPADLGEAINSLLDVRLGKLDTAVAGLAGRLAAHEEPAEGPSAGETLQAVEDRLAGIEESLTAPPPDPTRAISSLLSARTSEWEARLRPVAEAVERQMALLSALRTSQQAADEAAKLRDRRLVEIFQAISSLDASQQSLAQSLAAWRVEIGGDISIVNNRLEETHHAMLELYDRLTGEVQALRQEHLENGTRRGTGFKRWLYGTPNVFGTSWHEGSVSIRYAPDRPRPEEKS